MAKNWKANEVASLLKNALVGENYVEYAEVLKKFPALATLLIKANDEGKDIIIALPDTFSARKLNHLIVDTLGVVEKEEEEEEVVVEKPKKEKKVKRKAIVEEDEEDEEVEVKPKKQKKVKKIEKKVEIEDDDDDFDFDFDDDDE